MNFESLVIPKQETKIDFLKNHELWFENTTEKYATKLRDLSFKAMMILTSLTFAQQEMEHLGGDLGYDFKKYIMIGFMQKAKEKELDDSTFEYGKN